MEIKVLGPGCQKCHELDKRTREVVQDMGIDVDVEYVQDINKLIEYSILFPPGLVINGKMVSSGKVLSKKEIEKLINTAVSQEKESAA